MQQLLKEAEKYTIYVTLFLLPLVFLPSFFNPFTTAKVIVLVIGVAIALVLWLARIVYTGSFEFNQGSFDFPVFLLIVVYLLSGIYTTPNKIEAFFLPGTATLFVAGGLLYFLVNQLEDEAKNKIGYIILGSSLVVGLIYMLAVIGLFQNGGFPDFMKTRSFTPQGALLPTAIMFLVSIPYGIGLAVKSKGQTQRVLAASATVLVAVALLIAVFNMISDRNNFRLASFDSSLSITFDSLKNSAILGIGPSNYITAYSRFRPISSNVGDDWSIRYTQARNFYFTSITETGFAGTFALILLLIVLFKMFNSEVKVREIQKLPLVDMNVLGLALLFVVFIFFPATAPEIVILMFTALALATKSKKFKFGVAALAQQVHMGGDSKTSKLPALIVITPILVGIAYLMIIGAKVVSAERDYKVAIDHLTKNEGTQAYETLQKAINTNPYVDRYHATYSQINFLLANAVAKKKDLSDADKQTITKLVEQSIREAKATVALNATRSGNWEILGNTYRNVMPLSKDASNFAIQSYSQAVVLDPLNPNLRISLGGIWYAIKNYDVAVDTFKLAVLSKPDHANARYNLASAYRENGQVDKAIAELKAVLTLVKSDSKDYETAKKELDALESKKTSTKPAEGENLTVPPTAQPAINPQIKLPAEAAPEISPTPSATPAPTATPSPTPTP